MRLYLDENLSPRLAEVLRSRGLDAVSAHEVGKVQLSDRRQLEYATAQGRAVLTRDVGDFSGLAIGAVAANADHAGIILIPSSFGADEFVAIADGIEEIMRRYPEGLPGTVVYVNRG